MLIYTVPASGQARRRREIVSEMPRRSAPEADYHSVIPDVVRQRMIKCWWSLASEYATSSEDNTRP